MTTTTTKTKQKQQQQNGRRGREGWLVECCFTSTETVGLLGTGAQDDHLDVHTALDLCRLHGPACIGPCRLSPNSMHSTGLLPHPSLEEGAGKQCSEYEPTQGRYSAVVMGLHTLRASLSGTFLQGRKDAVNQCLEFGIYIHRSMAVVSLANAMAAVWFSVAHRINIYIYIYIHIITCLPIRILRQAVQGAMVADPSDRHDSSLGLRTVTV